MSDLYICPLNKKGNTAHLYDRESQAWLLESSLEGGWGLGRCVCVYVCVRACVCARVCVFVCVCVFVLMWSLTWPLSCGWRCGRGPPWFHGATLGFSSTLIPRGPNGPFFKSGKKWELLQFFLKSTWFQQRRYKRRSKQRQPFNFHGVFCTFYDIFDSNKIPDINPGALGSVKQCWDIWKFHLRPIDRCT